MDIAKCTGDGCPSKEECFRYTAPDGFMQSYFLNPPIKDGKCDMYWRNSQADFLNTQEDIVDGEAE